MPALAIRCWFASAMIVLVSATASAGISQSTISAPGGFAQAGAYSASCGCGMDLGNDMALYFGTAQDFHEQEFAGVSSAQASAAYASQYINNSANATAGLGVFRPFAANSARPRDFFPMSAAHGGWKESFTVSNAALSGEAGYMVFQIRARGTLNVAGFYGSGASLGFQSYKDGSAMIINPYYDRGNSDVVGNSIQHGFWGVQHDGTPVDRTIDGVVTMAAPITFGQPFTLGVYALAHAGMSSVTALDPISTSRCDFSGEGITWNGVVNILDAAGQPVAGSTIASGSGIDWTGPYTPPVVGVGQFDTPTDMSIRVTSATPFAGEVRFSLFLPHAAAARVGVYDVLGRRICALVDGGWLPAGDNELVWDGRAAEGATTGTGVYFVRVEWKGQVAVQRLVRVR